MTSSTVHAALIRITAKLTGAIPGLREASYATTGNHAFVYAADFQGHGSRPEGSSWPGLFLRFTVCGYAIALAISLFVLWTFERLDGLSAERAITTAVVLGLPAGIGAAAGRLLL